MKEWEETTATNDQRSLIRSERSPDKLSPGHFFANLCKFISIGVHSVSPFRISDLTFQKLTENLYGQKSAYARNHLTLTLLKFLLMAKSSLLWPGQLKLFKHWFISLYCCCHKCNKPFEEALCFTVSLTKPLNHSKITVTYGLTMSLSIYFALIGNKGSWMTSILSNQQEQLYNSDVH